MISELKSLEEHLNISSNAVATYCDIETKKRQERRIKLLERSGHFGNDCSGAVYQRATNVHDLEEAYRLVHDVYVSMGYITKQRNGLRMRPFEFCPETATFVAKDPLGAVIGSVSVIVDSPDLGLPSDCVFKEEIGRIRGVDRRVCEISNLAVRKKYQRLGTGGELMRCAWAYAVASRNTDVICVVSPQLVALYETIFFRQAGPKKQYCNTVEDYVTLIHHSNIHTLKEDPRYYANEIFKAMVDYYYNDNPHFAAIRDWNIQAAKLFNEEFDIAGLFGKCPEIFLDHAVSESLHKRLGNVFVLSQLAAEKGNLLQSTNQSLRQNQKKSFSVGKGTPSYLETGSCRRSSQAPLTGMPKVS